MPAVSPPPDLLRASREYCRKQTRGHARSFYFASFALPAAKKEAAFAIYSFCRYADDLVDRAADPTEIGPVLQRLGSEFDAIVAGRQTEPLFCPAFADAVNTYGIEKQPFLDLIKGVASDLGPVRVRNWPELHDYCYHVASTVGLMMARIFEVSDDKYLDQAIDLGIAMQLTNILRDIAEDYANERIYLPETEMAEFGIEEADLAIGHVSANFQEFMQFQIQRARSYYLRSEEGIPALKDDGSQYTAWVMRMVYAGILDEIEGNSYDVFGRRAATGVFTKFRLAVAAYRRYIQHRPRKRTG